MGFYTHPTDSLLPSLTGVEVPISHTYIVTTAFSQDIRCLYLLRVIVQQPSRSVVTLAGLLIRRRGKNDVAVQPNPLAFEQ